MTRNLATAFAIATDLTAVAAAVAIVSGIAIADDLAADGATLAGRGSGAEAQAEFNSQARRPASPVRENPTAAMGAAAR